MNKPPEEYLAWPPLGVGFFIFIGITFISVFNQYYQLISLQSGHLFAGFIFPIIMALAFAWRLQGKFWLGFAWLAMVCYLLAWLVSLSSPTNGTQAELLLGLFALFILFSVQSLMLFLKRKYLTAHKIQP